MNKNLKPKIIELSDQGYSYNQIADALGCSKGTISYHLGQGQKEKSRKRCQKAKKSNPLRRKYWDFLRSIRSGSKPSATDGKVRKILHSKRNTFASINRGYEGYDFMFTLDELLEKFGDNPTCYLTGREIDLSKSRTYSLDHIIPRSKGGDNSLENCGLTCRDANQAKYDLTLEEFVSLCQEVVDKFKQNLSEGT